MGIPTIQRLVKDTLLSIVNAAKHSRECDCRRHVPSRQVLVEELVVLIALDREESGKVANLRDTKVRNGGPVVVLKRCALQAAPSREIGTGRHVQVYHVEQAFRSGETTRRCRSIKESKVQSERYTSYDQ